MDQIAEGLGIPVETFQNIVWTIVALVVVFVLRRLARRVVRSNVDEEEASSYRANKIINYAMTALFLTTAAFIWFDAFSSLPTYLGLLSAGIAIALADVLKNMVGWAYILARKPFQVGDRVEVEGVKGDVVDIRLFRFSLMEIDGWVDAEQSTGRLVHVPNGIVFNKHLANYTEGFGYIWHEIPILITFESDWKLAERFILEILERDAPDVHGAAGARIRRRRGATRFGSEPSPPRST